MPAENEALASIYNARRHRVISWIFRLDRSLHESRNPRRVVFASLPFFFFFPAKQRDKRKRRRRGPLSFRVSGLIIPALVTNFVAACIKHASRCVSSSFSLSRSLSSSAGRVVNKYGGRYSYTQEAAVYGDNDICNDKVAILRV